MQIAGTTVVAQDVEAGAALVFTTTSDVEELRRRVARMAEKHAAHDANCMHGMKGHAQCGQHAMPGSEVTMEPTDGGARLVFTPKDPSQLAALREHVARHAGHMSDGTCPMMKGAP